MTSLRSAAALTLAVSVSAFACGGGDIETPADPATESADAAGGSPGTGGRSPTDPAGDGGETPGASGDDDGGTTPDPVDGAAPSPTPGGPITAKAAAAAMGRGFNLGQMCEAGQHPCTFAAAKPKIDAYYAKGFRSVRIPITWTENVAGTRLVGSPTVGDVNRGHPRLKEIEKIVDYALSLDGMYVVINAHHESGLKTQNRASVLERLWDDISDVFHERDARLLYEFLNEPHVDGGGPMPPENLRNMTKKAYAKVRAREPARIVIIGGNQWFGFGELANVWKNLDGVGGGSDAYMMATYHHYNPWSFCGTDPGNTKIAWTANDVNGPMNATENWAKDVGKGLPLYIGEWGVGWQKRRATMDCNNVRKWYKEFENDGAVPHGQPTAVWDDGGWFKIFEHGKNAFVNNLADCIAGSCAWTGTERINGACN